MNKAIVVLTCLGLLVPTVAMAAGDREATASNESPRVVERGYRGPGFGDAMDLKAEPGVLVTGILEDSPAEEAGIIRGDVILAVNGQEVDTLEDIRDVLIDYDAGATVEILLLRGGEETSLSLDLETRLYRPAIGIASGFGHDRSGFGRDGRLGDRAFAAPGVPGPGIRPGMRPGMGPGAGRAPFFHGLTGPGYPVMAVEPGSPAEVAGLRIGDMIAAVDGVQVDDFAMSDSIDDLEPGDVIELEVRRPSDEGGLVTVTLEATLGEGEDGEAYLGIGYLPFRRHAFAPEL